MAVRRINEDVREFFSAVIIILKVLAGIFIAFLAVLLLVYLLPLALRAAGSPAYISLPEALREFTRGLGTVMGGLLWAIFGVIIAIIVIWVIAAIFPVFMKAKPWRHIKWRDEALETLRLRYAKGEITEKRYLEMKRILEEET
ncbi:MAG: SHOCT domain-containing protein [Candidatus Bathyarchaeia archaeon]